MRKISLALAAATVAAALTPQPSGAQQFDHLKCYKIKDFNAVKVTYTLDLTPEQSQFLIETGCQLKNKAKWLCTDVQKTNVAVIKSNVNPPPPLLPIQGLMAQDYLCYALKCPATAPNPLAVEDQFGRRNVELKDKPDHLCVPARQQTRCCQFNAGSLAGSCFDALSADAIAACQLASAVAVLAPPGDMCNANTGLCGPTKQLGVGCCECARSSPPYPNPTECWDLPPGNLVNICQQGCTWNPGEVCNVDQQCEP